MYLYSLLVVFAHPQTIGLNVNVGLFGLGLRVMGSYGVGITSFDLPFDRFPFSYPFTHSIYRFLSKTPLGGVLYLSLFRPQRGQKNTNQVKQEAHHQVGLGETRVA